MAGHSQQAKGDGGPIQGETASMMDAVVTQGYGSPDRLHLVRKAVPVVGDTDVLVRVAAAAVCRGDVYLQAGQPYLLRISGYGLLRPRHAVPGQSFAGEVAAVGRSVTGYRVGDGVYGEMPSGALAQYALVRPERMALRPAGMAPQDAAALPLSGGTALQGLRDAGRLAPGQHVLINGASGGVGTLAVQIAKAMGAASVTAVCSARHAELMRSLGADEVVDYARDDFTRRGPHCDVLLDLVANRSLADCARALRPGGRYVSVAVAMPNPWVGPLGWFVRLAWANVGSKAKFAAFMAQPRSDDLAALARMAEGGQLKPVIEHRYPLSRIVDAYAHVSRGHSQGATVVEMDAVAH